VSRSVAEFLVKALEKTGVRRVYGVVGDSLNGFTDVMRRRKSIDWVHMRHEESAILPSTENRSSIFMRRS
jgi:pyruvate dehydrogenase (quinone)